MVLNENYPGIFALVSIDLATKEGSLAIVYRYQYIRALAGSVSRIHCRVSVPYSLVKFTVFISPRAPYYILGILLKSWGSIVKNIR